MKHKFRFTKDSMKRMTDFIRRQDAPRKAAQPPQPVLRVHALTDVGRVRPNNQDALIVCEEAKLYGVADGMGGHNGGETASAGARDGLIAALRDKSPSVEALHDGVVQVNAELFRQQAADEKLTGMGTTLSVLWMNEHYAFLAHVGDSRIYRFRDGRLEQLTDDHSLVGELVRAGFITPEQAENHPNKNVILRAVGTEAGIDVDLATEARKPGDIWLICSDGLHGMVSDSRMEALLAEHPIEECASLLMEEALHAGGRDNVSVVLVQDGEVPQ